MVFADDASPIIASTKMPKRLVRRRKRMVHDMKNKSRMTLLLLWVLVGLSAPAGLWGEEDLKQPMDSVQRDKSKSRANDPVNGMSLASLMKK